MVNKQELTTILGYHAVQGRLTPAVTPSVRGTAA